MYRKILVGGVTAAVILGAGTAALATSGSTSTSGTPSTNSTSSKNSLTSASGKKRHPLLRRASHAEITVKTKKGYVTHDLINGTVTAVSATSITVQAGDKTSETYAIGKGTKVVAKAATPGTKGTKGTKPTPSSISKVTKGQHVIVAGTGTTTLTAKHVVDLGTK